MSAEVPGAEIEAIVSFSHLSGSGAYNGISHGGGSILATRYAIDRGIDLDDHRLRTDLLQSWCAITPTEILFCKPHQWSVRPKPGPLVARVERTGTALRWADNVSLGTVTRMMHLEFPDERHLLSATIVRAGIRRKNYSDEPDLFVEALGPCAVEVVLA